MDSRGNAFGVELRMVCVGVLWSERNRRIFKGLQKSPREVADSILFEVASWVMVTNELHGFSLFNTFFFWDKQKILLKGMKGP